MITRTTCRVCDSALEPVLDLGAHYVSNFISPGEPDGTKAPLELVLCRRCRLLQLKHTLPAETMYQNYWYRSGTNQTMRNALADIANKAETLIHLKEGEAVVDIGCNDGTLLGAYIDRKYPQDRLGPGGEPRGATPGRSRTTSWSDSSRRRRTSTTMSETLVQLLKDIPLHQHYLQRLAIKSTG